MSSQNVIKRLDEWKGVLLSSSGRLALEKLKLLSIILCLFLRARKGGYISSKLIIDILWESKDYRSIGQKAFSGLVFSKSKSNDGLGTGNLKHKKYGKC